MFGKKKAVDLPTKKKVKSVSKLIADFTEEFREVESAQSTIVEGQELIIASATEKRDFALEEQRKASNFIKNINSLCE